jgi:hypothetical protein
MTDNVMGCLEAVPARAINPLPGITATDHVLFNFFFDTQTHHHPEYLERRP